MKYQEVYQVILNYFSYEYGLDSEDSLRRFERSLRHAPYKESLRKQVLQSLSDDEFSWLALLEKESIAYNEVIATEEDARQWAREWLLNRFLDKQ